MGASDHSRSSDRLEAAASDGGGSSGGGGSNSYASWYQTSPGFSPASSGAAAGARGELAKQIARRPRVSWWLGLLLALGFALVVTPAITAERWLPSFGAKRPAAGERAAYTVRVPPFSGAPIAEGVRVGNGGVIVARGEVATAEQAETARRVAAARPQGAVPYAAWFALTFVFAAIFTHHLRRSVRGRLLRVQLVSLAGIAALAIAVKVAMLASAMSILVVPVALLAIVPTIVLDRVTGLATGVLGALVVSLLVPFDVTVAILLLVQAASAGLVVAETPKRRWKAAVAAGAVATLLTVATLILIAYLTRNAWPSLADPLRSPWLAAAIGPALALVLATPLIPLYQLAVGEITHGRLVELEDLSHPLLRQIAEKAPGTWQHSLMMANMAEIAANAIGASGRLVRVGAYYHDLGKSLQPKYFIENLEPGETSPHDQLPPEVSCDAIFAHVTEGIVFARRAGLHERIVDFMHMHHGNGVLEYFWGKATEQGNPRGFTIEHFRYPGHPPQSRETAILAICDAVEAASRTLKKPDAASIDALVQRIVYGKLHLGQLDESGLSMGDLRRVSDSLRETIRHANHGRIEYPWQKAQQDASADAAGPQASVTGTAPRLDSLDRLPRREPPPPRASAPMAAEEDAFADTADLDRTTRPGDQPRYTAAELGIVETAPLSMPIPPAPAPAPPPDEDDDEPEIAIELRRESTQVGRAPAPVPTTTAPLPAVAAPPAPLPDPRDTLRGRPAVATPESVTIYPRTQQPTAPAPSTLGDARPPQPSPAFPPSALADARSPQPPPAFPPSALADARSPQPSPAFPPSAPADARPPQPSPAFPPSALADARPPAPLFPPSAPADADELITPVMPAALGERYRSEVATPPTGVPTAPMLRTPSGPVPTTLPGRPAPTLRTAGPPLDDDRAPPVARRTGSMPATRLPPVIAEQPTRPGPPRAEEWSGEPRREESYAGKLPRREDSYVGKLPRRVEPPTDDARITGERRIPGAPPADLAAALDDVRVTGERRVAHTLDASATDPALPRFEHPDQPPPGSAPWSTGLASRIDAALKDEWANETPVVPPTKAELRALLGAPDPTRQQSIDELEALHRAAEELQSDPELLVPPRRAPHPTSEVDPDQIEAAIELAPPARRPQPAPKPKPKKPG